MIGDPVQYHGMRRRDILSRAIGLSLTASPLLSAAERRNAAGPVFVHAGRRVDAPNATTPRFPAANVDLVKKRIHDVFTAKKPAFLVTAAACGADLLTLEVAGDLKIKRIVLLPSEPPAFRQSSVVDRPGDWGTMFDRLIKEVQVEVLGVQEGQAGYLETNLRLLDRAQSLASANNTVTNALVVWDKKSRGPDDVTGHFLAQARLRKMPILEISTL